LREAEAHTAQMRCVRVASQYVTTATAALVLVTTAGCSSDDGPPPETKVVFDGEAYTIDAPVSCTMSDDGKLIINAADGRKKLIRVVLTREPLLVVHAAGFRHLDVRGYTDDEDDVWATKVDDTYTITGRMPPGDGETDWHQFEIDVDCLRIAEFVPGYGPPEG
jgi:lipoprotein antigen